MFLLALLSILGATVNALPELSVSSPHGHYVVHTDDDHVARGLGKRQSTVSTNVFDVLSWAYTGSYYVNITVGNPPQPQTVLVTTGASDLIIDAASNNQCQTVDSNTGLCVGGVFDPRASSSFQQIAASPALNITYVDGTSATGPLVEDTIAIGNVNISNVQFGLVQQGTDTSGFSTGVMGIGYSASESIGTRYPNIPEVLVAAGAINSRLYSLYLNDARNGVGTILFGGIDRTKFTGDMTTINLIPSEQGNNTITDFVTTVTDASVTVKDANGTPRTTQLWSGGSADINAYNSSDKALPVLLGTGGPCWEVPNSTYNAIKQAGFSFVNSIGQCPCSSVDPASSINLVFAGKASIEVSASQFFIPVINQTTREPVLYPFTTEPTCGFLICPQSVSSQPGSSKGYYEMGYAVLSSMYLVHDLDNGQISIAQAKPNSTEASDIITVEAGPTGVADAISSVSTAPSNTWSIAGPVTTGNTLFPLRTMTAAIGTATGVDAIPLKGRPSSTETSNPALNTDGPYPSDHHSNTGAIAGGVVGGLAGLALIVGVVFYIGRRMKRQPKSSLPEMSNQPRFYEGDS